MSVVRCIKGAEVQKLKSCGEVIFHGRSAWDLCAGRRTGVGVGRLFMIKQSSSKQHRLCV